MPYASEAQRRYFHANKDKLQSQGVNVSEWDEASKGKKLPERTGKKPSLHQRVRKGFSKAFPK